MAGDCCDKCRQGEQCEGDEANNGYPGISRTGSYKYRRVNNLLSSFSRGSSSGFHLGSVLVGGLYLLIVDSVIQPGRANDMIMKTLLYMLEAFLVLPVYGVLTR